MTKIETVYKTLGKRIDDARINRHMTFHALATKARISRPALSNMVAGRQRIYLHHLLRLQKILKIDLLKKKV